MFAELGDKTMEANCVYMQVKAYHSQLDYENAIKFSKKYKALLKDTNDPVSLGSAGLHLADLYMQNQSPKECIKAALEAKKILKSIGHVAGECLALSLVNQAHINLSVAKGPESFGSRDFTSNNDKAIKAAQRGIDMCQKGPDETENQAAAQYWLAQALLLKRKDEDALTTATEAQTLWKLSGNKEGEANAIVLAAQCLCMQTDWDKAKSKVQTALKFFKDAGSKMGEYVANQIMDQINENTRQPEPVAAPQFDMQQMMMMQQMQGMQSAVAEAPKQGLDFATVNQQIRDMSMTIIDADSPPEDDTPLMEAGMDSLSSVQFRSELAKAFNLPLPPP